MLIAGTAVSMHRGTGNNHSNNTRSNDSTSDIGIMEDNMEAIV